jgi:invasion protein IalB
MYDDDEPPRRRRSIVPILAIIAALLAVAVGIAVVLFVMGFFDRPPTRSASSASDITAPASSDATPLTQPDATQDPAATTAAQTDVPKAVVSVAPAAQGEPPVRSTHGDWQVRCDTPAGAQGEQCVLMQFVTAEDRDNVGLTVIVLKTAD